MPLFPAALAALWLVHKRGSAQLKQLVRLYAPFVLAIILVVLFSCENRSVQPSTLEVVVNDTLSGLSKTIQPDESVLGDSKGIDAYRIVVTPDNSTSSVADTGVVSKGCESTAISLLKLITI